MEGEGKRERERQESKGKERGICKMEELKEGTFFCSSDMFKADPLGFLFLCFCHSPSLLCSDPCSFSDRLSEVSIASGHSVVDFEFSSPFGKWVFVCERTCVGLKGWSCIGPGIWS